MDELEFDGDRVSEDLVAYRKMPMSQKRKMLRSRRKGPRNTRSRIQGRRDYRRNRIKIRRRQRIWRRRNRNRIKHYRRANMMNINPKMEILQALLAILRAVHWSHWTSHWQVKGDPSYGDHLLMQRLYEGVESEIDNLAEKIVGEFGPEAVSPVLQAEIMISALEATERDGPIERALLVEERLQNVLQGVYDRIERLGDMSLGLDDYIMSIANGHETNLFLLRQRMRG